MSATTCGQEDAKPANNDTYRFFMVKELKISFVFKTFSYLIGFSIMLVPNPWGRSKLASRRVYRRIRKVSEEHIPPA